MVSQALSNKKFHKIQCSYMICYKLCYVIIDYNMPISQVLVSYTYIQLYMKYSSFERGRAATCILSYSQTETRYSIERRRLRRRGSADTLVEVGLALTWTWESSSECVSCRQTPNTQQSGSNMQ